MALATTADGLVEGPTTDLALIESGARPHAARAAATRPPGRGSPDATAVHFITDGATARPLDADVFVHSVFEPAANVGITALEVRPSLSPGNAGDAYLEIGNFAASAQKVRVPHHPRRRPRSLNREFDAAAGGTAAPGAADPPRRRSVADGPRRGVAERAGDRRPGVCLGRARPAAGGDGDRHADAVAARRVRARPRHPRDVRRSGELRRGAAPRRRRGRTC